MVIVSIILGLGLTLVLRGVSRLMRSPRPEVTVVLWAVFLVFLYLQNWWAFWDLSAVSEWNMFSFMFIALYTCVLYAMSELMLPMASTPETDWKAHFLSIRRWYFGLLVLLAVLAVLQTRYLLGVPLLHPYRLVQVSVIVLAVVGWFNADIRLHRLLITLLFAVLLTGQLLFRILPGLQ